MVKEAYRMGALIVYLSIIFFYFVELAVDSYWTLSLISLQKMHGWRGCVFADRVGRVMGGRPDFPNLKINHCKFSFKNISASEVEFLSRRSP